MRGIFWRHDSGFHSRQSLFNAEIAKHGSSTIRHEVRIPIKVTVVLQGKAVAFFSGSDVTRTKIECADKLDFLRPLSDDSIQIIANSPPDDIGKACERSSHLDNYLQQQRQVIAECVRVLNPEGSICWQVGNHVDGGEVFPMDIIRYPVFQQFGLKLRNRIIWHFGRGLHCSRRFSGRHETILWFTKADDYTRIALIQFVVASRAFSTATLVTSPSPSGGEGRQENRNPLVLPEMDRFVPDNAALEE